MQGFKEVVAFVLMFFGVSAWFAGSMSSAQEPEAEPEREFFSNRTLRIYCTVENTPAGLESVELWFTADNGASWQKYPGALLSRDEDGFLYVEYVAPEDGEYGFRTVATDRVGNREDEPKPGDPPTLVAVVDTKPPVLRLITPAGGETLECGSELTIAWDVTDEHLDERPVMTVEISRDGGASWEIVGANERTPGTISITLPSQEMSAFLVRVTAEDLAGNMVEAEVAKPIAVVQAKPSEVPKGPSALPPARTNNRVFNIDYEVDAGESGLKAVVLWYTEDGGQTWKFYGYDSDLVSPIVFRAPKDGVFGFYIVAYNMAGKSARPEPTPGTLPDRTTHVDAEPPKLVVTSPEPRGVFAGGATMEIAWIAHDNLLVEEPVTIFYREDETRPWTLIARSKDSIGKYAWELPFMNTRKLAVKVAVEDIGKNVTECVVDNLVVDSKEIKLVIRDVKPAEGEIPAGMGMPGGTQQKEHVQRHERFVNETAARTHFEKGRVLRAQQRWADAAKEFELAVQNKPDFRDALNDLGCVLYRMAKYQEAAAAFSRAAELTPHDPELCYNLAAALFGAKDFEKAADLLLPLLDDLTAAERVRQRAAELLWSVSVEFHRAKNPRARVLWTRLSEIKTFTSPIIQKAKEALAR